MARPALPFKHSNPVFKKLSAAPLPPVKYQILSCQGKDILVGRLKIDTTEGGHAFILRRFDTNAISLTTMFRAAFPSATDNEEKAEIAWVKEAYDLFGTNGSSKEPHITRLAGVWVNPETALELAAEYHMEDLIQVMVSATPDPTAQYRRSNKNQAPAAPAAAEHSPFNSTPKSVASPSKLGTPKPPSKTLPTPSPGDAHPPVAKRRREGSPAIVPSSIPVPSSPSVSKTPRRSARTKSPAPTRVPQPLTATKPRSRASVAPLSPKKRAADLPKSSPVKGEDDAAVEEGVAGAELYEQDISEQKKLIADLKAAATSSKADAEEQDDEDMGEESSGPSKLKRIRQDAEEKLQFQFKEPEKEERQIASNRRIQMNPQRKSLAWGLAVFAVSMGAISYLPNLF